MADGDTIHDFGSAVWGTLREHGFRELRRFENPPCIAIDFANQELAIRLIFDYAGESMAIAPISRSEDRYSLEIVLQYLGDSYREGRISDEMESFERRYAEIVVLFRDIGSRKWRTFEAFVEERDRRRFHYDRITGGENT